MSSVYYEKDNNVVGISDKYVYLEEIYEYTPRSYRLAFSRYISCKKPLSPKKTRAYKKFPNRNISRRRILTLLYAPENYLVENDYRQV